MPKQQLAIVQFHGGVQDALDQRDIPEEALAECTNASITKLGAVRTMAVSNKIANPTLLDISSSFTPGYGYYIYGADYDVTATCTAQSIADYTAGYNDLTTTGDYVQVNVSGGHGLSVGDKVTIAGTSGNYNGTQGAGGTTAYYNTHAGHPFFTIVYVVSDTAFVMDATYDQNATVTTTITVTRITPNAGQFVHKVIQYFKDFHIIAVDEINGTANINQTEITLGSDTADVLPVFHKARGGLRVCDANFDNTNNEAKWYGYIPEKYYGYGSAASSSDLAHTLTAGYYSEDMFLIGGGSGQTGTLTGASAQGASTGAIWYMSDDDGDLGDGVLGADSDGVVWSFYSNAAEGEFHGNADGDEHRQIALGHSWIYDGYQETPPTMIGNTSGTEFTAVTGLDSSQSLEVQAYIKVIANDGTLNIPSKRITGMRLYLMGTNSSTTAGAETIYDDPFLLAEVDLTKGIRTHNGSFAKFDSSTKYADGWHDSTIDGDDDDGDNNWAITTQKIISDHPNISFRMLNGYSHKVASTNAKYKTSCVVDGRAYIGNIQQDVTGDGVMETFEDRVLVCAVGAKGPMPDVFPSDKILEITSNDGDQIVRLISHKEKIIQLNRAKAIIINVYGPNDLETVESTWDGAGITHPAAATSFSGGIVWANKTGCYLYNGEAVLNLVDNKLDKETWRTFIEDGANEHCFIGYCGKDNTITISNSTSNTYTYSIITQSWMKGVNLIKSGDKSNFISSNNDQIEYATSSSGGLAETFTHAATLTEHVQAAYSVGTFLFNKWDGNNDPTNDHVELFAGASWRTASENTITWTGGATTDKVILQKIAHNIRDNINMLADGTYAFDAEYSFLEQMGQAPEVHILTVTARNSGTTTNADDTNDYGDATFDGFRFASTDNATGLSVVNNNGDALATASIIAPSGGVAAVAQVELLEVNRGGQTSANDYFTMSFAIEDPILGEVVHSTSVTYTTSSSDTEEEVTDGLLALVLADASTYVTPALAKDITGAAVDGSDHNFLKLTTKQIPGTDDYYKIVGLTSNVVDNVALFHTLVPTIPKGDIANFSIKTRDIDLGAPGVRKKIYKVYVTYKCTGGSKVTVTYGTDQSNCTNTFDSTKSTNYSLDNGIGTLNTSSGNVAIAELKPTSSINNIYSFQIQLSSTGPVPEDFEINDITVVYRPKRVK